MANFVERFKAGYALTTDEWCERNEVKNAKKGFYGSNAVSLEIHPTFLERVRRGIQYILQPEDMRSKQ